MSKKIIYVNDDGVVMKQVLLYFEFSYTGQTITAFATVPQDMPDEEIMNLARDFRNSEIKYGFCYPDEDEDED